MVCTEYYYTSTIFLYSYIINVLCIELVEQITNWFIFLIFNRNKKHWAVINCTNTGKGFSFHWFFAEHFTQVDYLIIFVVMMGTNQSAKENRKNVKQFEK